METVGSSPPEDDDLQFLTKWGDPWDRPRERRAAAVSALIHVGLVLAVVVAPAAVWETPSVMDRVIIPLIAPLTALTQTTPNEGKVNSEFRVAVSQPKARVFQRDFNPAPAPPPPKPLAVPEPPRVEDKVGKVDLPQIAQALPQPKLEAVERPKLVLENPVAAPDIQPGQGRPLPKATADAAIRGAMGGQAGGYDLPSAGSQLNNMQLPQLLSDPMGVDFKPYLAQVLAAVKQYWMRIWPQSARQGRSGKVILQFSVDRFGGVPKLVIASGSGVSDLDLAAVAAVSNSVPFPSLPREYKGDQIRLQLNFSYNLPN